MTPARGREMIDFARAAFRVSIRRACRAIPACRATYHYRSRRPEQAPLRQRIREIAEIRMRYGYRRITVLLRREGWHVNVKRVHRLTGWKACKCGSNRHADASWPNCSVILES
jgi:transposase InsO family protein